MTFWTLTAIEGGGRYTWFRGSNQDFSVSSKNDSRVVVMQEKLVLTVTPPPPTHQRGRGGVFAERGGYATDQLRVYLIIHGV